MKWSIWKLELVNIYILFAQEITKCDDHDGLKTHTIKAIYYMPKFEQIRAFAHYRSSYIHMLNKNKLCILLIKRYNYYLHGFMAIIISFLPS